ncbi:hypothetical protein PMZ80_005390 [Knufia obscura]|uniref:Zn(2)-C6 fungal-type domain-containing protein n=1 Tax=Knufia obscura TaxID=1635080 RepID=A0ABR0RQD8_9EURO|nr:hypothetical protein PMZ80_005390 [Knufia obscura]
MADHSTTPGGQSVYPLPPADYSDAGYRYEDASQSLPAAIPPPPANQPQQQQQLPVYAEQPNESLPGPESAAAAGPPSATKSKGSGEVKPRLRKACDSCSVRKVKCDESGPPCKSCTALDIPCTFNRPSRRRGPPNRHAEAIKRQRLDDGSYNPMSASQMAASPTRDAAYGLAALSAPMPQQLSAEMICDIGTLHILIDDYFAYIHPLIPIPHEPTFREQLRRREDVRDRSFLALLAGMIEALVTSFPRRVKQVFQSPEARAQFPHASALISRCHSVFTEARGKGFIDRDDLNLYDACSSYMAAISFAYMFDLRRWRLYCSECITILRTLNYHKVEEAYDSSINLIDQQIGRRLFWLCFVGTLTVRQLGNSDSDILMPHAHSDALPPMPVEVDDRYIMFDQILAQPQNELSEIVGFNYNIRIYRAFHAMTALEMAFGTDVLFDWDRQRFSICNAIRDVKAITKDAPPELKLQQRQELGEWPSRQNDMSQYSHAFHGRHDAPAGLPPIDDLGRPSPHPRKLVQFEMQKVNIYGTQLATRSYLVERYWNLYEIREHEKASQQTVADSKQQQPQSSPAVAFLASGLESRFQPSRSAHTPSESLGVDEGEQQMAIEREDIVRDMARLLRSVSQINMEPNGHSFCHKIRQVASTLLSQDRSLMSRMPTLDNDEVQEYLRGFIDILAKLERIGSSLMRGGDPGLSPHQTSHEQYGQQMPQGQGHLAGIGAYAGKTQEEIEEEELVQWASLKEHQERFVNKHEGYLAL